MWQCYFFDSININHLYILNIMNSGINILICVAIGVIAAAAAVAVTLIVQRSMAKTRAKSIVADAERDACE